MFNIRAIWLCFGAFLSPPARSLRIRWPLSSRFTLHAPRRRPQGPAGSGRAQTLPRWLLPDTDRRIAKDTARPNYADWSSSFSMSPDGRFLLLRKSGRRIGGEARQNPQTPMLDRECKERWQGVCCRGTKPGLMAETSPRGIDRRRRGPAGGWWRGTSQWRTFCSTCSPAVGGRQYRVRGDAQVRLRSGLEAPMKLRPLARHRPPNSSLPELDAIFIIPGVAKRHKRLRKIRSVPRPVAPLNR